MDLFLGNSLFFGKKKSNLSAGLAGFSLERKIRKEIIDR
jgi:hypothetical protein